MSNFYLEAYIKISGERLGYLGESGGYGGVIFWGYGEPNLSPEQLNGKVYKLTYSNEDSKNLLKAVDHGCYIGGSGSNGYRVDWKGSGYGVEMRGDELWMVGPDRAMCFYGHLAIKQAQWNEPDDPYLRQNILSFKKIPC